MQEDLGSVAGMGRFSGEGTGYLFQYSGLENSMDCKVHEVAKSRRRLSNFHFHRRQKEQNKNIWKHNGWKSPKSDENTTYPQSCTNFKKDKFKSTPTVSCKMKTKKKILKAAREKLPVYNGRNLNKINSWLLIRNTGSQQAERWYSQTAKRETLPTENSIYSKTSLDKSEIRHSQMNKD